MKSIATNIVQKSEIDTDRYNKDWFINLIKGMSQADFNRLCKEVMHLRHYYETSVGLICTDDSTKLIIEPDKFWQMEEIDFDAKVNFKKIS